MNGLIIILLAYFFVFSTAELLYKKGVQPYLTRKIAHIGSGIATALMPFFLSINVAIIMGLLFSVVLLLSKQKKLLNSIYEVDRESSGPLLFALGATLSAVLFWNIDPVIFQGTVLILGFSDGLAGIVGKSLGKRNYSITGPKTLEGSFTFFITTLGILLLFCFFFSQNNTVDYLPWILLSALILTATEGIFSKGWDNLFIVLTSGVLLYLIL